MLNIAQGLAAHDDLQVDLLLVKAEGPYLKQVGEDIRIVDLNCSRIITSLPKVIQYLKKEKPVSVLSALDTTNLILIWAKLLSRSSTRIVVSVHCNFTSALQGAKNFRANFLPKLVGVFYKKADAIVAVSEGVAADLEHCTGIKKSNVQVLFNPVITDDLKTKKQSQPDHKWFQNGNKDVILGIGRLTHQKNFHLLINAFKKVSDESNAKLLILGSGDQLNELQDLTANLELQDKVEFAGFVSNPYAYLSNARLFVLSSRYEGLPTVLIEALYCGAEVISTDCPSGPSEILHNGKLGKLVPTDNVDLLAQAIIDSLSRPKTTVPRDALAAYEHATVVSQYRALLLPTA